MLTTLTRLYRQHRERSNLRRQFGHHSYEALESMARSGLISRYEFHLMLGDSNPEQYREIERTYLEPAEIIDFVAGVEQDSHLADFFKKIDSFPRITKLADSDPVRKDAPTAITGVDPMSSWFEEPSRSLWIFDAAGNLLGTQTGRSFRVA